MSIVTSKKISFNTGLCDSHNGTIRMLTLSSEYVQCYE